MTDQVSEATTETEVVDTTAVEQVDTTTDTTEVETQTETVSETTETTQDETPDWRDTALSSFESEDDRKAAAKFLKSYDGLGSLVKGALKNKTKLADGGLMEPLDKDASPEQKREFFEKAGFSYPGEDDGYSLELEASDNESATELNEGLNELFSTTMKEHNVPVEFAGAVKEFAAKAQELADERLQSTVEAMEKASEDAIDELWPTRKEKQENLEAAGAATAFAFGKDWDEMRHMTLSDGTRLGDYPDFVQGFSKIGRLLGEGNMVDLPSASQTAANAETELDGLMKEHYGKPTYSDPKIQARIDELTTVVTRRKQADAAKEAA